MFLFNDRYPLVYFSEGLDKGFIFAKNQTREEKAIIKIKIKTECYYMIKIKKYYEIFLFTTL